MSSRLDRWTLAISLVLVLGALLACKRKKSEPPATVTPAATPAASPEAPAATAAAAAPAPASAAEPAGPKVGDVKRYPDKEKREDEAAVKILEDNVKVFNEADSKTPEVATLPKGMAVVRLANVAEGPGQEAFMLVEFPSSGQLALGWVESKFLETKGAQVARDKVLTQTKTASIAATAKPAASTKPATSASAAATALPTASASALAAAAAKSAAPLLSAVKAPVALDPRAVQAAALAAAAAAAKKAPAPPAPTK